MSKEIRRKAWITGNVITFKKPTYKSVLFDTEEVIVITTQKTNNKNHSQQRNKSLSVIGNQSPSSSDFSEVIESPADTPRGCGKVIVGSMNPDIYCGDYIKEEDYLWLCPNCSQSTEENSQ